MSDKNTVSSFIAKTSDSLALADSLIVHFHTALELVQKASNSNQSHAIMKDISWLWRTAYNCGIKGCTEWSASDEKITSLFVITSQVCTAPRYLTCRADLEAKAAGDLHPRYCWQRRC